MLSSLGDTLAALAALAGSQLRSGANGAGVGATTGAPQQTQEMTVPNELIGCIIGKGGTKIAEIRYVSPHLRPIYVDPCSSLFTDGEIQLVAGTDYYSAILLMIRQ